MPSRGSKRKFKGPYFWFQRPGNIQLECLSKRAGNPRLLPTNDTIPKSYSAQEIIENKEEQINQTNEKEEFVFLTSSNVREFEPTSIQDDSWIVDSDSSNHYTNERSQMYSGSRKYGGFVAKERS